MRVCPESVRYIGKTDRSTERRLNKHIEAAKGGKKKYHVYCWMRSLFRQGKTVALHVLASCPSEYGSRLEKRLIRSFRLAGAKLTNHTDGGEGCSGLRWNKESRKNAALGRLGKSVTEKHRLILAQIRADRWSRPENRRLQSEKMKSRHQQVPFTDERKRRISEALKGKSPSAATREKLRIINLGKRHTIQARRKKSQTYWRQLRLSREHVGQLTLSPEFF